MAERWHKRRLRNLLKIDAEVRNGAVCAILVAAGVLMTYPVAAMGVQDDWSYARTAMEFARTGHFVYNGWATAMLGWMVPWAAIFIKIFGFSFTVVRLSTLPLAMMTSSLLYASLRRLGVGPANAVLGSLTISMSPVFLPMEASYMTDVAGMLAIVLCLYLCLRAAEARTNRAAISWLCCAAVSNVVGGTARQISWLGVLVMVPSTAWLLHRRRRRGALATASLLWVTGVASIVTLLHWWSRQPYSVPEHIDRGRVTSVMVHHFGGKLVKGFLCLMLLVFPVLAGWIGQVRVLSRGALVRAGALTGAATIGLLMLPRSTRELWALPWIGHLLYSVVWGRAEFVGDAPASLSLGSRVAISLLVVATGMICFEAVRAFWGRDARTGGDAGRTMPGEVMWILVPFSVAYFALLLPRTLYEFLYDRYLIGVMPLAIVVLMHWHQRWVARRMPAIAFAVLAIFSAFTIAGTHDWFATNRARVSAVNELTGSGVAKTSIQAGFEYDGWTEIEVAGHVNEKRMEVPRGAYIPREDETGMPVRCLNFFAPFAPAIHARYLLASSPMACFESSGFAPVTYGAWLPPRERRIYIQQRRDWKPDGER